MAHIAGVEITNLLTYKAIIVFFKKTEVIKWTAMAPALATELPLLAARKAFPYRRPKYNLGNSLFEHSSMGIICADKRSSAHRQRISSQQPLGG